MSRTVLHYEPNVQPESEQLKARLVELAGERRRFGYRRLHALVRREGVQANHKRIYRRYTDAGLSVNRRKRRHGVAVERQALERPTRHNQVWSMDFVSDALANGRRIKVPTIVDDFGKAAIDLAVDFGISGHYVIRILDQVARFRGYPKAVRTDQGPGIYRQGVGSVGVPAWRSTQADPGGETYPQCVHRELQRSVQG